MPDPVVVTDPVVRLTYLGNGQPTAVGIHWFGDNIRVEEHEPNQPEAQAIDEWMNRVRLTPPTDVDWTAIKTGAVGLAEVIWVFWQGLVNFGVDDAAALALALHYQSHLLGMAQK